MANRTPRTINESGSGGVDNRDPMKQEAPEQDPEYTQGGAPAGPFFGADRPVSNPPLNATTGGYSPGGGQDPLEISTNEGAQKPPSE